MHLTNNNIDAIAEVAVQLLGAHHPLTDLIIALRSDPDLSGEAWRVIETLPDDQRKTFAAMVAERTVVTGGPTSIH